MSYFSDMLARPDQFLEDHLNNVRAISGKLAKRMGISKRLSEDIAFFHDIFKSSISFQKYIHGNGKKTGHAKESSLIFYSNMKDKYDKNELIAGMASIAYHHSNFLFSKALPRELMKIFSSRKSDFDSCMPFIGKYGFDMPKKGDIIEMRKFINSDEFNCHDAISKARLHLSVLMNADRIDSSFSTDKVVFDDFPSNPLSYEDVESFVDTLSSNSEISLLRRNIFDVVSSAEGNIVIVEAPTGSGKTLANLALASKLGRRIIYSLPYLSIIDQTYDVINDIVLYSGKNTNIIRSDHKSEYSNHSFTERDEDLNMNMFKMMYDSWQSDVVVTTFNRLANILVNPSKRDGILRLYSLFGSVVIIDEVQAFPPKYWKYLRESIEWLSSFGVKFIISSATMPPYFKEMPNSVEAVPLELSKKFSATLSRYTVIVTDIHEADELVRAALGNSSSVMIVVNTRKRSVELYNKIKDAIGDLEIDEFGMATDGDIYIANLSTLQFPAWRTKKIERIKQLLKEGRRVILVSTQLIEAGVDISFPVVYRDIAPIDSIIQSAGRCNRSGEIGGNGLVYVTSLINDRGRNDASSVYGIDIIYSYDVLGSGFLEKNAQDTAKRWYMKHRDFKSIDSGIREVEISFHNCNMVDSGKLLSGLYDNIGVPVLVGHKNIAYDIINIVEKAKTAAYKDKILLSMEIKKKMSEISNYIVNLGENEVTSLAMIERLDELGLYFIGNEFHNKETGLDIAISGDSIF